MRLTVTVALVALTLAGCGGNNVSRDATLPSSSSGTPTATTSAAAEFTVTSPAFADNMQIPVEYSCNGRNVPPPLRWQGVPAGATSLALVVDDPDAPAGLFVHWVVTGIPPSTTEITEGKLPDSAVVSSNSAGKAEYLGPCPPAGTGVHHYRFQLYALDKPLTLAPATPAPESAATIHDSAIATARTDGLFGD